MAKKSFHTVQGVQLDSLDGIKNGYEMEQNKDVWQFTVVASAEKIAPLLKAFVEKMPTPGYFTLELPDEDAQNYSVYYLDGCTRPVLAAVVERYGDLLINDGFVRFGFAGHDSKEELFVTDLKTVQIYTVDKDATVKMLEKLGYSLQTPLTKLWDIAGDDNRCVLSHVEVEEESIFDLPDLLEEAGIYLSGKRER